MLKRFGVADDKVTRLYMATKCDHVVCGIETRYKKVSKECTFYENGVEIRMQGDGNFIFETWTIWEGRHVLNSHVVVNKHGVMIKGSDSKVNCFNQGWHVPDQDWVDILITELEEGFKAREKVWTKIE